MCEGRTGPSQPVLDEVLDELLGLGQPLLHQLPMQVDRNAGRDQDLQLGRLRVRLMRAVDENG